jgi:L-malate glycosyltransferase
MLDLKLKVVSVPSRVGEQIGNNKNIEYYNNLPYKELFNLYAKARCIVIPIKSGVIHPSGIRALLEAMTLGKAIIISRTDILAEYLDDGQDVIMVEPGNCELLAEKIKLLYADTALCRRLGSNAKKKVSENFDIRFASRLFADHLENIMQK